jgi:hypothetical protein
MMALPSAFPFLSGLIGSHHVCAFACALWHHDFCLLLSTVQHNTMSFRQ